MAGLWKACYLKQWKQRQSRYWLSNAQNTAHFEWGAKCETKWGTMCAVSQSVTKNGPTNQPCMQHVHVVSVVSSLGLLLMNFSAVHHQKTIQSVHHPWPLLKYCSSLLALFAPSRISDFHRLNEPLLAISCTMSLSPVHWHCDRVPLSSAEAARPTVIIYCCHWTFLWTRLMLSPLSGSSPDKFW